MTELAPWPTLRAGSGMVCSIDHLASQAGLAMLRAGGSAVDAAVACSAVLSVTSPHVCGVGGDLLAVVVPPGGEPVALDASGRAGSGADPEALRAEGHRVMPFRSDIRSVPVPGCVDGWLALHERFGRLPLADVLAPAEGYARDGFPASPTLAAGSAAVRDLPEAADLFDVGRTGRGSGAASSTRDGGSAGGGLRAGAWIRRPGMARVLRDVAERGRLGFYGGEFGEGLLALGVGEYGEQDLISPLADWVQPLTVDAWGTRLWTVPPGSQGYLTLASAWIASGLDVPDDPTDPLWPHLLVESARQAARDRLAVLYSGADGRELLSGDRLGPLRSVIRPDRVVPAPGSFGDGDTIALCTVDRDRMGVSLLQSNASGFGSHLIVPGVRVFLHNRGIGFSLEAGHPGEYGPGRKPAHTLSPLAVTDPVGGGLRGVLGSMGGDGQPQFLLQLLARWLVGGESPGPAVAAGRWGLHTGGTGFDTWDRLGEGLTVRIEANASEEWAEGLAQRGHRVEKAESYGHGFGHAHMILAEDTHLAAGTDPRPRFGAAAGY